MKIFTTFYVCHPMEQSCYFASLPHFPLLSFLFVVYIVPFLSLCSLAWELGCFPLNYFYGFYPIIFLPGNMNVHNVICLFVLDLELVLFDFFPTIYFDKRILIREKTGIPLGDK